MLQIGKSFEAELSECTDGDTAVFTINGKEYKTRFLYIDTPESTRMKEAFGPEAAQYTCSFLKQGDITLELAVAAYSINTIAFLPGFG
ncbi:thermonuclease family protein [Mesobacillus jeotgali]|uniref:thermonuclease family protein n=1 Tax=Mesobacillus jeotgali TaxID=129985 RepID=UPI001CFD86A6|nr:hypothetical protein [Mesobacillus jeotgali]